MGGCTDGGQQLEGALSSVDPRHTEYIYIYACVLTRFMESVITHRFLVLCFSDR